MIEILFATAFLVLCVVLILMAMAIKCLSKEIGEIKEKLEYYRINLEYIKCCVLANEHRIDKLELELKLKEWPDEVKGGKNEKGIEIVGNIYDNPELKKK